MAQRNWIFFSLLFFAPSRCDKDLFCLSHWVTATNRIFVCRTKAQKCKKKCKKQQKVQHFWPFWEYSWQHIPILSVTVTQCNKQKSCLLQWLILTNKTNLFCSDSMRQTILKIYPISLWHVTKELEMQNKNKHPFIFKFQHRYQNALGVSLTPLQTRYLTGLVYLGLSYKRGCH